MVNKKTKKGIDLSQDNLVSSLLSKNKKTKISSLKYSNTSQPPPKPKKLVSFQGNNSSNSQIISNFHKAINSTNSDDIILKMLDLKEKDIVIFYKNLEKLIGKDMSGKIKSGMAEQLINNKNQKQDGLSLCPFCTENKSNCVILLCGHMLCSKCAKNINRCKYPCPKCKKPIKYIQYIVDM